MESLTLTQLTGYAVLVLGILFIAVIPVTMILTRPWRARRKQRALLRRIRDELAAEGIDPDSAEGRASLRTRLKASMVRVNLPWQTSIHGGGLNGHR